MIQTKIGLIGCGDWGKNILRDLKTLGCHVTVVCLSKQSYDNALSHCADEIVQSITELPAIDGIIVATPAVSHFSVIEQISHLNIPIFVEKPMTADLKQAEYLAKHYDDRLFVMHKWRYHKGVQALAKIVRSKELGNIRGLHTKRQNWGNHHPDVDMIWTCLPHDLSITIEILGSIPEPRFAVGLEWHHETVELTSFLGENPWNIIHVSSIDTTLKREIKIECEDGIAILNDGYATTVDIHHRNDWGKDPERYKERRLIEVEMPLLAELKDFVTHLRGGPTPKCNAQEGLAVVRTITELRQMAGINHSGVLTDISLKAAQQA